MNRVGCKFMSSSRAKVNRSAVKVLEIMSSVRWSSSARCHVIYWRHNLLTIIVFDAPELYFRIILKWIPVWSRIMFFGEKMTLVYLIFWLKMLRFTHIWKKRKLLGFTLNVHFQDEAIFSIFRGYISARNVIDDQYDKYSGSNNDNCCTAERMLRLFLQNSSEWNWRRPVLLGRKSSKFKLISLRKLFAFEPIRRWC